MQSRFLDVRSCAIVGSLAEAQYAISSDMVEKAKAYLPQEMLAVVSKFEKQKR